MLVQVKNSLHLSTQRHSGSLGLMSEVEKKKESLKALQIMYRVNYSEKKSTFKWEYPDGVGEKVLNFCIDFISLKKMSNSLGRWILSEDKMTMPNCFS